MTQRQKQPPAGDPNVPLPDPEEVQQKLEAAIAKVRERKAFYTAVGVLIVLAVLGILVVANLSPTAEPSHFLDLWNRWDNARKKLVANQSAQQELVELEGFLEQVRGKSQEGSTLWLLAIGHYREAWTADKATFQERKPHLEKANEYLQELKAERFDDLLLAKPRWFDSSSTTPIDDLARRVADDLGWEQEHAYDEPLPDPDTVAVLRTSAGDIHLQFYPGLAPKLTKNFISLATKGTYNETYFYFVRKDLDGNPKGVMAGDPFTFFYNDPNNKQHLLRWGEGGVGYDVPPEEARTKINHRRAVVTSQMRSKADWNNGSQFMIMTATDTDLDRSHTPFAKVVEGMNVVDKLAQMKTASTHSLFKDDPSFSSPSTRDLAVEPVLLHKVVVFGKGKAIEHAFELSEDEKSLSTIAKSAVTATSGDAAYFGRKLRAPDSEGAIRLGLDVPFPDDVDPKDANPLGERKS